MTDRRPTEKEGHALVNGYRLYWRIVGDPGSSGTLVALHGGPGATHDYLLALSDLAQDGYRVVYYDQLGCGRSELARDDREYSIDRDVADLERLRCVLGLGRFHLLGSSYGGLLAIAYALAHPGPIATLVSASGLVDVPLASREMQRLKRELPPAVVDALERHERTGDYRHPEYLSAVQEFYRRHLCRLPVWPPEVTYSLEHISQPKYGRMNGPNEFTILGTIRDYDASGRLGELGMPTLFTAGRFDEVTPLVARSMHEKVPGSELEIFEESSHTAFWEERERYHGVLRRFLDRHPA